MKGLTVKAFIKGLQDFPKYARVKIIVDGREVPLGWDICYGDLDENVFYIDIEKRAWE